MGVKLLFVFIVCIVWIFYNNTKIKINEETVIFVDGKDQDVSLSINCSRFQKGEILEKIGKATSVMPKYKSLDGFREDMRRELQSLPGVEVTAEIKGN